LREGAGRVARRTLDAMSSTSQRGWRAVLARAVAVAAVVGSVAPLACAPRSGSAPAWRAPQAASPTPAATAAPVPTEITLALAGDVHFTGRTLRLLDHPDTAFGEVASVLRGADLAVVNLETAVTTRGAPQPKQYLFRAPASAYTALRAAGVDGASVANNHTLDYGHVGLLDTLGSARAAGMPVFGAGRNAGEAYAAWVTTVRGVRVAMVGLSQVRELAQAWAATDSRPGVAMAYDAERAVAAVRAARQRADVVVVFMHWGVEGSSCPSGEMRSFAARMAGAGADVVVGTHAHTLLADGWLGRTYVHYGLGNFLWYGSSHSVDSGVLRLTVRGRTVVRNEFLPAVVSETGQPVLLSGAAAERVRDRVARAQRCTGLSRTRP